MKQCYRVFVCPECEEQNQFAGFCDLCSTRPRLEYISCIPVQVIREKAANAAPKSPAAQMIVDQFVDFLIDSSG